MPLHTDYRPKELEDFVGNELEIKSLIAVLRRKRRKLPHSFLFTGPKGCGKTTLARIAGRMVGARGDDLHEINVADFKGIDTARSLRRQVQYMPMNNKSKATVYIIDECHKLMKATQEAMLKLLEEPPDHIFFMLATTNPEVLLDTFIRRCEPYDLQPLEEEEIVKYLRKIMKKEKKEVPKSVRKQIAVDSLGSLGMALMLMDKIIDLEVDDMKKMARKFAKEKNQVIDLCRALINRKGWPSIRKIANDFDGDFERIRISVFNYCGSVLKNSDKNDSAFFVMEVFGEPFYKNPEKNSLLKACYECTMANK